MPEVTVRKAVLADAPVLYHWRNDPQTRAVSRDQQPIPVEKHLAWLDAALADPRRILLVGEVSGRRPVGSVRFDLLADDTVRQFEVSIVVAPVYRGSGLSRSLLAAGEAYLRNLYCPIVVLANVLPGNQASARVFARAGYSQATAVGGATGIWLEKYLEAPCPSGDGNSPTCAGS